MALYNVITIVSGLPRSGTSMMMKMLDAGGLDAITDNVRKADVDNPKGYYEFEIVKKIKDDSSWIAGTQGKAFKMVAPLLRYLPNEFQYQIIFMRRDMKEMLESQNKMLKRLGQPSHDFSDEKLAELFTKQLGELEPWLNQQENVRVLHVTYNEVLAEPVDQIRRVAEFIEQDLDTRNMLDIVDPSLYRNMNKDA